MSRETIEQWWEATANRHPGYCTGSHRFGPTCYDCSGATYMGYKAGGLTIPADSSLVARWGRDNGQVHPVAASKLMDLLVHDRYGDPYNSSGPRGHIGCFIRLSGDRVVTYESASSGHGVGVYSRPISFWAISVQHPAFATTQPEGDDDDMTDAEKKMLFATLAELHDKVGWLLAGEIEGGYEKRAPENLRTPKIAKKVGA